MSHKHDYVKELCSVGGMSEEIAQAAIYFYHSDIPLVDARRYIRNLKQTIERTGRCGVRMSNGNISRGTSVKASRVN